MLWTENNITSNNIDTYILEKIPWFSDFFYQIYDDSDRELKFEVFWSLTDFFRESYKKNDQLIINLIIDQLHGLYNLEDKKLKDLILTWFIENLLEEDKEKMSQLRESLKYPEFQEGLDELYKFWYKTLPYSHEKPKNN